MNNDITYNGSNTTIANTFWCDGSKSGGWTPEHNVALSRMVHEMPDTSAYCVLMLLNDIVHNETISRAVLVNAECLIDGIRRSLESEAASVPAWRRDYDRYCVEALLTELDTWRLCSERSSCPGVPNKACLGARADLAWSLLCMLDGNPDTDRAPQVSLGDVDLRTITDTVRHAIED
jgi:hypothetical protein